MATPTTPDQHRVFFERYDMGYTVAAACRAAGFSRNTGDRLIKRKGQSRAGSAIREERRLLALPSPKLGSDLDEESPAARALHDFGFFQRRYFGRVGTPWQIEAAERMVAYLESPHDEWVVVNAPPGCLAADTKIRVNRGHATKTMTIEDLVFKFNGGVRGKGMKKWDPSIPTFVQGAKVSEQKTWGLHVRLAPLTEAYCSGEKEVFELRTVGGRRIKATADHHFAIDGGSMVPLSDLSVGDTLLVNGGQGGRNNGSKQWYDTIQGLVNHPQHGAWPYRQPTHRLVVEADMNGLPMDWYVALLRDKDVDTSSLKFLDVLDAVHHIDENTHNNVRSNLEVKRHVDHWRDHGLDGGWAHVASHIETDIITSIDLVGVEPTYDLAVGDAPHNFIANEFVVHNSGKSTLFTLDIPAWLTCRNRAIRGLIGSATQTQAEWYVGELRDTFERSLPAKGEPEQIRKGLAFDAEATLSEDFGRFKVPTQGSRWSQKQFVVEQTDGQAVTHKESTWSAFGKDGGFLGGRFDFVVWDDLVDDKRLRSIEQVEQDQNWFVKYAESRLEPGGVFILQGQRLGPSDLYRYALDMRALIDEEDDWDDEDEALVSGTKKKYHHIIYRAHYDDRCSGPYEGRDGEQHFESHKRNAAPYPEGCLLVPWRLSWSTLAAKQINNFDHYQVLYQQEDIDPGGVLVNPAWVTGEGGHPGCWDMDRDRLEVPAGLDLSNCLSIATADPSPTRFWCIQHWLYDQTTDRRYLIDLLRKGMTASQFLDWNADTKTYTGVMEEWQQQSYAMGIPITHWIVEENAAQTFLLQYNHVKTWMGKHSVEVKGHKTHKNKSDPTYGVQTLGPHWQFGRVRLPGKPQSMGRMIATKLVSEVTRYNLSSGPQSGTDDCVMAEWFFEWWLPQLQRKKRSPEQTPTPRPTWFAEEQKHLQATAGMRRGLPAAHAYDRLAELALVRGGT